MKIHLNGRLVDQADFHIEPTDRGLTLGDGLYETIRAKGGRPLRLAAHLARLATGAETLGIPLPDIDITAALRDVLAANAMADAVLRLTLTRGPAARGLATPAKATPTLLITANPPVPAPAPARLIIARTTRRNEHSPTARCKTLNGLDNIIARREAEAAGADDALLLNTVGNLAESTIANLFVVIDGVCWTPPVADGALPGVMRAELVARAGVRIRSLTLSDLQQASEAFLSNANGLRPICTIGDGKLDGPGPGPLTSRLLAET